MKVLLINPCYIHPLKRYIGGVIKLHPAPPLGLASIAAVLEANNVSVKILDMVALDLRPEDVTGIIRDFGPDIVGISCNMAFVHATAISIANHIRSLLPIAPIIIGGSHATFVAQEIIENNPSIDAVVLNEGEVTFLKVVLRLAENGTLSDIQGVCIRDKATNRPVITASPVSIENLDSLPTPARHLLPMDKYPAGLDGTRGIMTSSRGCPFKCVYCSTSVFHGRRFRYQSVDRMVDEIEILKHKFGANFISFADDTFTLNRLRVLEFCSKLIERNMQIQWGCDTRVDLVDPELLSVMRAAGCNVIFFGIESASQAVLDRMEKGFKIERAKQAVWETRQAGIEAQVSFVIGLPGETYASTLKMKNFLDETKADGVLYNILIAYPGSRLYENPEAYGISSFSTEWESCEQMRPMVQVDQMSHDEIRRAYVYLVSHLRDRANDKAVAAKKIDAWS